MNKVIPFGRGYKFAIRITNSKNNKIMIGVVSHNRLGKRSSFSSGEAYCYYGYNGWICEGRSHESYHKKGNGFRTGETVIVIVDLEKGMIEWHVENRLMASHNTDKLRKNVMKYVPYIEMHDTGDSVRWLD